jgi:hypothetical protein
MFHDIIANLVEVDDQLIAFDGFDTAGAEFLVNTRSPTEKGAGGWRCCFSAHALGASLPRRQRRQLINVAHVFGSYAALRAFG